MSTKKRVTKNKISRKSRVIKGVGQSNLMGMAFGALVVLGLGWYLYKMNVKIVDVNKISEVSKIQDIEMAKWSFDTAADFGVNGVWRPIGRFNTSVVSLKDGKLVWSNVPNNAQVVAGTVSLDMTQNMRNGDAYVVKVKADLAEQAVGMAKAPTRADLIKGMTPAPSATPRVVASREFGMKMSLIELYTVNGVSKERVLGEQSIVAQTNVGSKDYEFVFNKPIGKKVTRIRYVIYELGSDQLVSVRNQVINSREKTQTVMSIDEIKVVRRVGGVPDSTSSDPSARFPVPSQTSLPTPTIDPRKTQ